LIQGIARDLDSPCSWIIFSQVVKEEPGHRIGIGAKAARADRDVVGDACNAQIFRAQRSRRLRIARSVGR